MDKNKTENEMQENTKFDLRDIVKPRISTHILDTCKGCPAVNVPVCLYLYTDNEWIVVKRGVTNTDGRFVRFIENEQNYIPGRYKMHFELTGYFQSIGVQSMYPSIDIIFETTNPEDHYHIPLLLNPFGYSTYRGS